MLRERLCAQRRGWRPLDMLSSILKITLRRKLLKALAKCGGWVSGTIFEPGSSKSLPKLVRLPLGSPARAHGHRQLRAANNLIADDNRTSRSVSSRPVRYRTRRSRNESRG
jgi:hypothetical protein